MKSNITASTSIVCECGGMWFDRGELEQWAAKQGNRADRGRDAAAIIPVDGKLPRCPRCDVDRLQRFERGEARGSRCQRCGGIWLTTNDVGRMQARLRWARDAGAVTGSAGVFVAEGLLSLVAELLGGL